MDRDSKKEEPKKRGPDFHFNSYGPYDFSQENYESAKKKEVVICVLFILALAGVGWTTFFCRHSLLWPIAIGVVVAVFTEGSGLLDVPVRERFVSIYIAMMILCIILIAGGNIARACLNF